MLPQESLMAQGVQGLKWASKQGEIIGSNGMHGLNKMIDKSLHILV